MSAVGGGADNETMAAREEVERVAARVAQALQAEFPGVSARLDFEAAEGEHEDAYLWIDPGTEDEEEIKEIWGYAVKLVQDAYQDEDVYLVARLRGAGIIDRRRPLDQDF